MNRDEYTSPLISRYASGEMSRIFCDNFKYKTWRKLWIALAEAQKDLGINIGDEQIDELKKNIDNIDYDYVSKIEKEKKHDVMSHIEGYARYAPQGAGILHLGATSAFVTDNTDLIQIREAGRLILKKLLILIDNLSDKAMQYRDLPVLGFTHFQPAQPTTAGKRFCLWLYELFEDALEMEDFLKKLPFRSAKGTVGTMASYMEIFNNDEKKCMELDRKVAQSFGFEHTFPVTGQTYSRKTDYRLSAILSGIGQSLIKMATDIRLLQHRREVMEPFGASQVGSSAMPYKQNPMKCERITSLARYLLTKPVDFANIASGQWLERTLDDSALRRIIIPESFLTADAVLSLATVVIKGINVNERIISKNLSAYLPLMLSEKLIAVMARDGVSRQEAHSRIRDISLGLIEEMRLEEVLERFLEDEIIGRYKDFIKQICDPGLHTGLAGRQVEEFIKNSVKPMLDRYRDQLADAGYEHSI